MPAIMLAIVPVLAMAVAGHTLMPDATVNAAEPRPALRQVVVRGAEHTREGLILAEIPVEPGDVLDERALRETRRRLEETGLFAWVDLLVVPAGRGQADLEVDVADRHGFGDPLAILARAGVDLSKRRLTVHYANVAGRGLSVGGWYRWERAQPSHGLRVDAVNPFGIGANLFVEALTARPTYDIGDDGLDLFTLRTRGADVGLRRVMGPRTTLGLALHYRERRYTVTRPDTQPGHVTGLQLAVEHRLVERPRHRVDAHLGAMRASSAWGSSLEFTRGLARVSYLGRGAALDRAVAIQRSEVAVQLHLGHASQSAPLDEMFAPGAAGQIEFPLRAHRQKRSGVLGRAPIGRSLALANLEVRRRLLRTPAFQLGGVLFYDVGRIGRTVSGGTTTLHDLGVGLRLGLGRSALLRTDFAYSPTDGKTALTAGIGQAF